MTQDPYVYLSFVQVVFLSAAIPLSTIAAVGFHGTPWGRVLRPLPVVELLFVAALAIRVLGYEGDVFTLLETACYGGAVVGTTVAATRLARIVSGGVQR